MSSSAIQAIQMFDASALGDLLSANLSKPEITSMMVFTSSGAVLAHASTTTTSPSFDENFSISPDRQQSMELRRMRDLASVLGDVFTMKEDTEATHTAAPDAPPSHEGGKEMYIFDDDDFVSVASRLSGKLLLAVIGPSSRTLQQQAQRESHLQLHLQANGGSISRKPAKTAKPTTTNNESATPTIVTHPLHPGAAEDTRFSSSAPDSYSMFSTNGHRSQHLRSFSEYPLQMYVPLDPEARGEDRGRQNHAKATKDEVFWKPDERQQDELMRLASLHVSTIPEVLYALESKALALSTLLSRVFAGLRLPKAF